MTMSCSARAWMAALAMVLLLPVLGMGWQNTVELEQFHKHRLAIWPERGAFVADPVAYFGAARNWLRDRAFPIMAATRLEKRLVYHLLRGAPEPRITLGKNGHVFVNGTNNQSLHRIFESTCIRAHQRKTVAALEKNLGRLSRVGARRRLSVDVIVVPTAASVYGDALPDSVSARVRSACLARTSGDSALLDVKAPSGVGFVYPLREMLALRSDAAFFPRGNWHPVGKSLQVVRDTYLATRHLPAPGGESLERGEAPAELLFEYGIEQNEPVYVLHSPEVSADPQRNAELRQAIADLFQGHRYTTQVLASSTPVAQETVVMLSDSFGDLAAPAFAGAFRRLIHVNTNDLRGGRTHDLLDRLQRFEHVDRLLLLVQEGNTQRIKTLLR
jgi:hypothetical protein